MSFSKIYNGFCIPAIIIHELLHYFMIKLTFSNFNGVTVSLDENYEKNGSISVNVFYVPNNKIQIFLVSMAPFLMLFFPYILFVLGMNIFSYVLSIYIIFCIKVVLPSKEDFDAIKGKQK